MKKSLIGMFATTLLATAVSNAQAFEVEVYNAAQNGLFPTSSELLIGDDEVVLVDAQFDTKNAQHLVDMIKATGKPLAAVYISGGDPDYYFGLETIVAAFPDAKVMASEHVVHHIEQTKDGKLAYWGPILGDSAPSKVIVPTINNTDTLTLNGQKIEIKELNTDDAFLWAPSVKTVFGGVAVSNGLHVWMADSQTKAARQHRIDAMNEIIALNPEKVIPGHYIGELPTGSAPAEFTRDYIATFEAELAKANDSSDLVEAMKAAYPNLMPTDGLTIGAKVATGEMKW